MDNIRRNNDTFVLSVINVQPADVGDYLCNASDGVGQLVASLKIRGVCMLTQMLTSQPCSHHVIVISPSCPPVYLAVLTQMMILYNFFTPINP